MKKYILSCFTVIIALLMVSTVTTVSQMNYNSLMDKIRKIEDNKNNVEEIFINLLLDEDNCEFSDLLFQIVHFPLSSSPFLLLLLLGVISGGIYLQLAYRFNWFPFQDDTTELLQLIKEGKSIMGCWPHPDDEVYSPGIYPMGKHYNNQMWIVHLISVDCVAEEVRDERRAVLQWFEKTYLEKLYNLEMVRGVEGNWHGWEWVTDPVNPDFSIIKQEYKAIIEAEKPDILITFTPFGFADKIEHGIISDVITEIWHELEYTPKPRIFWFVNVDQGPLINGPHYEHYRYPPKSMDLDVYSNVLGRTFWDATVEIWEQYSSSVPPINAFLNHELFYNNDHKAYWTEADYTIHSSIV